MMKYKIANIHISISDKLTVSPVWKIFKEANKCSNDISIIYQSKLDFVIDAFEVSHIKEGYILRFGDSLMILNDRMNEAQLIYEGEASEIEILIIQCIYSNAYSRKMLLFHSSLIDHRGHGLMFLGPSGIGKTTQAELWNKYRDALIINGDIVFVQETDDGFLGWGTPWHGSSPYCENTSVPLKAMIVLKQAPENSIRELTGFEKVTEVSNSVFYPQWLENGMELCLETLDHLLTRIPVYELSCRPDEDAVRLAEEALFGSCG